PSAALPASGSRGRPIGPLSHGGSPAVLRIRLDPAKSTQHMSLTSARQGNPGSQACSQTGNENLSSGRRLFHVGVKDGLPLSTDLLPDRGGVISSSLVLPIVRALNCDLVRHDTCIRPVGCDFVIGDRKRLHVPLLHIRQFFL